MKYALQYGLQTSIVNDMCMSISDIGHQFLSIVHLPWYQIICKSSWYALLFISNE